MTRSFKISIPTSFSNISFKLLIFIYSFHFNPTFGTPASTESPSICPNGYPVPFPCSQHVSYEQTYTFSEFKGQTLLRNSFESLHNYSLQVAESNSSEIEVEHLKVCLGTLLADGCSTFYPDCNFSHQNCVQNIAIPMIEQCFGKFPVLFELSQISAESLRVLISKLPNCKNESKIDDLPEIPAEIETNYEETSYYDDWNKVNFGSSDEENIEPQWGDVFVEPRNKFEPKLCAESKYFVYFNNSQSCAPRCDKTVFFTNQDKKLAFTWLCIWTSLCTIACGFTVLTYFLKCDRFSYPERPVIYMSCSCLLYAFGHLLREFAGVDGIGCLEKHDPGTNAYITYYMRDSLDGQVWCTFTFMMMYYSQMAMHVWWVILSFSWFLSSTLHWSPEALDHNSRYFHLVAWIAPACKTLLVLATQRFEGDSLTGLCLVGAQTPSNLAIFIIMPISIYLAVGLFLSIFGFCSLMSIRNKLKMNPGLKKMDFLIIRIVLFAVCYVVPCILYLIVCGFEYHLMSQWTENVLELEKNSKDDIIRQKSVGNLHLMLFKHSLTFFMGTATSLWMFNWKTVETWRECFCHTYSPAANYSPYTGVKPICPFVQEKNLQRRHEKLDFAVSKNLVTLKPVNNSHQVVNTKRPITLTLKPFDPATTENKPVMYKVCNSNVAVPYKQSSPVNELKKPKDFEPTIKEAKKPITKSASTTTNNNGTRGTLNPYMPIAVFV